ncbi:MULTISPECIES: hypothetical protein [unclassified Luteimonas]
MSDFTVFLLRLMAATVLLVASPIGPEPLAWAGALLLLAGFKARYVAGVLGVAGVMALLAMPWSFATQAAWLHFSATAVFTLGLFGILAFGPGGISADEWIHARTIKRAEAHCRTSARAPRSQRERLEAVMRCVNASLMPRSRLLAWLASPSNPDVRAR